MGLLKRVREIGDIYTAKHVIYN